MTNESAIVILPFASRGNIDDLQSALNSLSYPINKVSPEKWLENAVSDNNRAIVVFISDDNFPKQAICERFDLLGNIPKVAISNGAAIFKHRSLLDRCNEVINWPCDTQELSYRFERMLGTYADPDVIAPLGSELRQEFLNMNLVGESPSFLSALSLIKQTAKHKVAVLLLGETGTGKELAARALHYMGPRSSRQFIPVNCGALPESIFENEIFGHERGAFTDAKGTQYGLVRQAHKGTLFLDEIDSLSLKSQVVLLRFLEDHRYKPLGAQKYQTADIRIIAATNANLDQLVETGQFRRDLLFRLNLMQITMPPLRDRLEDIPLLACHFIKRYNTQYGGPERCLNVESLDWMRRYRWPGNVRELENSINRAFLISDKAALLLKEPERYAANQLDPDFVDLNLDAKYNDAKCVVLEAFEKRYLIHVLSKTGGNVSKAAVIAGKERRSLGRLIKKHGLSPKPPH